MEKANYWYGEIITIATYGTDNGWSVDDKGTTTVLDHF